MIVDNTADFKTKPITGRELLIGCGHNKTKQLAIKQKDKEWIDVVTLDMTAEVEPDVVWNLEHLPLPFEDETFEEIHAYDVLEHVGQQGDWKTFFKQFDEFHRILKPGGYFFAITPMWDSIWAWSDPGHTRIISAGNLTFLDKDKYGGNDNMTDYRPYYKGDFLVEYAQELEDRFVFVLRKK